MILYWKNSTGVKYKQIGENETLQIVEFNIKNKHSISIDDIISIEKDLKNNRINKTKLYIISYAYEYL